MLVSVEQLKKETNQPLEKLDAVQKRADSKETRTQDVSMKAITKGNILGEGENLEKRKEMLSAKALEPTDFAFERAIGNNDSLYSNFAELIGLTKRKVGRIVIKESNKVSGFGTGFMVSKSLLLTNWHVFKNAEDARESEIQFFYEYDVNGHPNAPVIFKFDTRNFYNDEELDYCFVGVQPIDVTGKVSLESVGYLFLDKGLGKIGEVNQEKLNIIHHPQGDYKQISIRENMFVDISSTKIFYKTDTAPGSSGSPVFNDQWQVVGLHHKSVAKMSQIGEYLDLSGNVIPQIDGKIDISRIVWEKNEGIRISVLLRHLLEKHPNEKILESLEIPPPIENLSFLVNPNKSEFDNSINENEMKNSNNITIQIPTEAISSEKSIDISISSKMLNSTRTLVAEKSAVSSPAIDEALLEIAKADKEMAVDFSECKGYIPHFLGTSIPMPQPKSEIKNQIARLKNNDIELKYFKYSVIFNALTKMPLISAINVEGDASQRPDNSKRSDDWLRDSRIDIECQLTDKYYAKSNLDKGHMSRFEDANWDESKSESIANRNGVYTCFYTNACPQVPALNRGGGLWGKLEKAILEKGVKKEAGKLARMTVFNGPIFNPAKDRIRKGVVIPMEFFKVILWLDDKNVLKATAFKLTQENDLKDVTFDEKMLITDLEALDIDKNATFIEKQINIKKLGELTKIDFKHIEKFDTFVVKNGVDEKLLVNEKALIL